MIKLFVANIPRSTNIYSKVLRETFLSQLPRWNSTSISRIRKKVYARMYPVRVINPDGSSYTTCHPEPIGLIRIPQDPDSLSEEEKKARLRRLKGEKIVDLNADFEEDDVAFDQRAVTRLLRKRKT